MAENGPIWSYCFLIPLGTALDVKVRICSLDPFGMFGHFLLIKSSPHFQKDSLRSPHFEKEVNNCSLSRFPLMGVNIFAFWQVADLTVHELLVLVMHGEHGGELLDFGLLKNGGFVSKPLDSGKTFFDISLNTDQIGMGFEADTAGK